MNAAQRFPAVVEAAGYLRQAVSLLNREGGVVLLIASFLVAQWVARALVDGALRDEAVARPVTAWLTALLFTPFAAAAVLKVRRAVAGRGVRWVPALEEAAPPVLRMRPLDWGVAGLLAWLLVGPPLSRGLAETQLLAIGIGTAVAAGATVLLLARGRGRTLMVTSLLLILSVVTYGTFIAIGVGQALSGPFLISPTLQAVEGIEVNLSQGNQTFSVPVSAYCALTAGSGTQDLLDCLRTNLPAERFASLSASINWAAFLISFLAHPTRGLVVLVPFLLLMPRLVLAIPSAAVEGGLGLRRSWKLTRGRFRVSFWLVAMILGVGGVLASGLGLLILAAGGVGAVLYLVRHTGHGRRLEGVAQSPWFLTLLGVAGLGLVMMAFRDLGPLLSRVFSLAVGGTAVTLFYLKLTSKSEPGARQSIRPMP